MTKGSKSKITHENYAFQILFLNVWYETWEVYGGYSCRLERLVLMRESNLKVLSRRRCPKSPRPGCVDGVS